MISLGRAAGKAGHVQIAAGCGMLYAGMKAKTRNRLRAVIEIPDDQAAALQARATVQGPTLQA